MRNTLQTFLLLAVLATPWGCKSPQVGYDATAVVCICGTPESQLEGCPHPLCLSGEGNPDNEDCVCGPLFRDE
jgi:hypothetical protein